MTSDDTRMIVFGAFDGLTSAVGLVLVAALTSGSNVLAVSIALAVGAAISMAAGEWLADDQPVDRGRRAALMGLATLVGSIVPALPFAVAAHSAARVGALAFTCGAGVVIAEVRPGKRLPSYAKTLGVLALSCGLAVGCALLGQAVAG